MSGKSDTASEYLASLVVGILSAVTRQMILDGTVNVVEGHIAGPVPDEGDYTTELEGTLGIDGTWIDPWLLDDGRKGEMEFMRTHGVFEVADEKECDDNAR